VALVTVREFPNPQRQALKTLINHESQAPIALREPFTLDGYQLTLHTYLESAFELSD
jgi:hypothetical protein